MARIILINMLIFFYYNNITVLITVDISKFNVLYHHHSLNELKRINCLKIVAATIPFMQRIRILEELLLMIHYNYCLFVDIIVIIIQNSAE